MREFIMNAIDTIKDDRFSWKFKLCNIITNDYLRAYTAFIHLKAKTSKEWIEELDIPTAKYAAVRMDRIQEYINDIWHI